MLVLTRRLGEAFYAGEGVRIVILEVSDRRVKVGVEAPESVLILREELHDADAHEAADSL